MSKQGTFTIQVGDRSAQASISANGSQYQINVFHPGNGGAGFFLVFPKSERLKALSAARALIAGNPLEPDQDITSRVDGCYAAGTVGIPRFTLGIPDVACAATSAN